MDVELPLGCLDIDQAICYFPPCHLQSNASIPQHEHPIKVQLGQNHPPLKFCVATEKYTIDMYAHFVSYLL